MNHILYRVNLNAAIPFLITLDTIYTSRPRVALFLYDFESLSYLSIDRFSQLTRSHAMRDVCYINTRAQ